MCCRSYSRMSLIDIASPKCARKRRMVGIMKHQTTARMSLIVLAALLLLATAIAGRAQTPAQQNPTEPAQTQASQASQMADLVGPLNLTPEQIQKWRTINADLKEEQQTANQRLRQARRALAEAIESPTPNEALVEQRAHDVSEAQAAVIRLQALKEARILQTLSPEQRVKLKEIRQRNQAIRRTGNQQPPQNGMGRRQEGLQRNANTPPPLRPNQRRLIRPQQKP
jgi:Spy/CpxP family protein refolding chaperone